MNAKEFLDNYLENDEKFRQSVIYVYHNDIAELMEKYTNLKIIEIIDECNKRLEK